MSVVIPAHQGAATIGETLESIARQSMAPAEVLVVDDGSTDGTADVAAAHHVGARVIRLHGNHGVAFARNVGLREATGDLVAFVDQDDLWVSTRLERVHDAFVEHPDWRVVVTDEVVFAALEDRDALQAMSHDFLPWVRHWRSRDDVLTLLDEPELVGPTSQLPELVPARRVMAGSISVTTSYVVDRELAMSCGGFAGWLRSADDWILLQTLSQYAEIWRLHGATVLYRVHPANTSTTTDWPMPLMIAAAAVRQGGRVVPRGADRDPSVIEPLASSPFLQHVLKARAAAGGWRARADALAAWQLLATDAADRRQSGRMLARSLVGGIVPGPVRLALKRVRGVANG